MSDIGFTISWWAFFFFPPVGLTMLIGWGTMPLAAAMAVAWLRFKPTRHDQLLLVLAVIAAGLATMLIDDSELQRVDRRFAFFAANFMWFALLLLPLRGLFRRGVAAWDASRTAG